VYFLFRFTYINTIEFGYDQPKLSTSVLSFLDHGSFWKIHDFVTPNPWGTYSWGPAMILFYSIFFLFSHNPVTVTSLVIIFNAVSIIGLFYLGKRFFSLPVAFISAFFLAIHPWWVIFSRMIYQPTPVIPFVIVTMFLFLHTISRKKSIAVMFLLPLWVVLLQLYINTAGYIFISGCLLIFFFRRLSILYFLLGILLSLLCFIPYIYPLHHYPHFIETFFTASNHFGELPQTFFQRFITVLSSTPRILAGGQFTWQLGYGASSFYSKYSWFSFFENIVYVLAIIVFIYSCLCLFTKKGFDRIFRICLLLWSSVPFWFFTLIQFPDILPRYFLFVLPSFSLLVALAVVDFLAYFHRKPFIRSVGLVSLVILTLFYTTFTFTYDSFIATFSYPNGFLSYTADPPYFFIDQSFRWIIRDMQRKGYHSLILSTDPQRPTDMVLRDSSYYLFTYVYPQLHSSRPVDSYYHLVFSNEVDVSHLSSYSQFGPYVVFDATSRILPNSSY
jgi:4-amino-4-deoxy-L-arabinose transferase-like glycosyltransferase